MLQAESMLDVNESLNLKVVPQGVALSPKGTIFMWLLVHYAN